jgi:hypothetical protein
MPLRIAFDLDGVLADMDSALFGQAEVLFGEEMIRSLQAPAAGAQAPPATAASAEPPPTTAAGAAPAASAGASGDDSAAGAETGADAAAGSSADAVPSLLKLNLTTRQQRRLWRHVEAIENFWETLEELEPGVIRRLGTLAADRRWEIIFLTKRPQSVGATAQLQSQRWLESKGFKLPSVFVVQKSRGRIAGALGIDVVVDDRPENCLDVVVDSKARAILVWRDDQKVLPAAARRLGIGVVTSVSACLDILIQLDTPPDQRPGVVDRVMRMLGLKETVSV